MEHSILIKQLLVKEILFSGPWRLYGPKLALCNKLLEEKGKLYLNTNGSFHTLKAVNSERNTFQWAMRLYGLILALCY